MHTSSSTLDAAIRAIRGESDLSAVVRAIGDRSIAQIVALAPETDPIVRAVAALAGELPDLLDARIIADPALYDAIAQIIRTNAGDRILASWTNVAPADWGRLRAATLIGAVQQGACRPWVAAALIGPCDESAELLHSAYDVAVAIRHWGASTPDTPIAWMEALSVRERDRLLSIVQQDLRTTVICLPWLPPDTEYQLEFDSVSLGVALWQFTDASPTARTQHTAIMQRLVAQARPSHLGDLTRMACAMHTKEVWSRAATLVRESPNDAFRVVAVAPWEDLDATVRVAILECADQSDICAAVAAAQGHTVAKRITHTSAPDFFAALHPRIWESLDADAQRRWLHALRKEQAYLAVRSIGVCPAFLARATVSKALVRAAQRHVHDDVALHWALFPVALRDGDPDLAHALIAARPTSPPAPGAFFAMTSGYCDPGVIASADATLCTNADLACAVALQRCVDKSAPVSIRCAALRRALRGRTWNDLAPIMALLDDNARMAITPDINALVKRLAHPERKEALRHALDYLKSLPPAVAIPTCVALDDWKLWHSPDAGNAIAHALRDHSDVFLAIVDAIADDDLQRTLLPLPEDAAAAKALRDLAHDSPIAAHRLAHALRDRSWIAALHALLTAPRRHADAIWQALPDDVRSDVVAAVAPTLSHVDPIITRDPIAALALAAVQSGDDDLRAPGVTALAARPDHVRTIWDRLPQEVQQSLRVYSDFTDLMLTSDRTSKQRRLCC